MSVLLLAWLGAAVAAYDVAAADSGGGVPDVSGWDRYGPGGALAAVLVLACWWFIRALLKTLDLERARGDRLEQLNNALNQAVLDRYVPAATTMLAKATELAAVTAETTRALQSWRDRDR